MRVDDQQWATEGVSKGGSTRVPNAVIPYGVLLVSYCENSCSDAEFKNF